MSDTHLPADSQTTFDGFRNAFTTTAAVVDAINALEFQIQFVLHTGDVGNDPSDALSYAQAQEALVSAIRAPLHLIPGNHDVPVDVQRFWPPHRPRIFCDRGERRQGSLSQFEREEATTLWGGNSLRSASNWQ